MHLIAQQFGDNLPCMALGGFLAGGLPCLFFGGFIALAVVLIIYSLNKAKQRRQAYEQMARELGFQFYPDDPWNLPGRYAHLGLFNSGHSRKASNILSGKADSHDVLLFDYQYTTGSGKDAHTYSFQAALLETPILAPKLTLRRESFLDTVASWVGHDDIDFESAEFSKRTCVKCEERKFAYDIFHARLIEYLLGCGTIPAMEFNGPLVLLSDNPGGPEKVRWLMTVGQEIIRSIPDYVLHERGTGAAKGGKA
jgi:hypothetical protein